MRIRLNLLIFSILLFFQNSFSQQKPAVLKIKFEYPQRQASVVTFENGATIRRTWVIDSTTTRTDSTGLAIYTFALVQSSQVQIMYFSDSTTLTYHFFFLWPGELLQCSEKGGLFYFEGENNAAKRNRFLHEIGILTQDSLQQKPLMRKVSDDIYSDFMRDMAEEKWQRYQTTQDTTDHRQNTFVKASLEAQCYNRIKCFFQTKDWTDEMFDRIKDKMIGRNTVFIPKNERSYKIPFRIVPDEDALLSGAYKYTLIDYLRVESNLLQVDKEERMTAFYDLVDKKLPQLPKTREAIIFDAFDNRSFYGMEMDETLLHRLEKDFPLAPSLQKICYAFWTNQKAKAGVLLPPVPLLSLDKIPITLPQKNTKGTLLLIWNTWEDSCQLALKSIALLAKKYDQNGLFIKTLCVRNRFDSWKEAINIKAPMMRSEAHLYADYPETAVLEGILGKQRPLLVVIDKEGKYVESYSPFAQGRIKGWLRE